MGLYWKTFADTAVRNKTRILIHVLKDDWNCGNMVSDLLMNSKNKRDYAVFFADDPKELFTQWESAIPMHIVMPIVSDKYMAACSESLETFFSKLAQNSSLLPIVTESCDINAFNRSIGNLDAIPLASASWKEMLLKKLERIIFTPELKKQISENAFSERLFLSYRKSDYQKALDLSKCIHSLDGHKAARIWFDDYLNSTETFDNIIKKEIECADFFVLCVTPNIYQENSDGLDNYVVRCEYPDAVRLGRNVVPIETEHSDPTLLNAKFPGLPSVCKVDDTDTIAEVLGDSTEELTPYKKYLLGCAFLYNYDVEYDLYRALDYFTESANEGNAEAAGMLSHMYANGEYVRYDQYEAFNWKQKEFDNALANKDGLERAEYLFRLIGLSSPDNVLVGKNIKERQDALKSFLNIIEPLKQHSDPRPLLWEAQALILSVDIEVELPLPEQSLEENICFAMSTLQRAKDDLDAYEKKSTEKYSDDFERASAYYYSVLSAVCRLENRPVGYNEASLYANNAVYSQERIKSLSESYEDRLMLATYKMNSAGCLLIYTSLPDKDKKAMKYMQEAAEEYEQLYNETGRPTYGAELAQTYVNQSYQLSGKEKKDLLRKAKKILAELMSQYPQHSAVLKAYSNFNRAKSVQNNIRILLLLVAGIIAIILYIFYRF